MPGQEPLAARLEGLTLDGGWVVERRLDRGPNSTGGNFSVGYIARHPRNGVAFLKALDYSRAFQAPDVPGTLQSMTEAFKYECRVLDKCRDLRMSRVVTPLGRGEVRLEGEQVPVSYLLFEHAEGDVRARLDAAEAFDMAWVLRTLHHVAVGLQQLHGQGIAHQDVKPSNVLVFTDDSSKIGDLGRADYRNHEAPWAGEPVAGDRAYAPVEQLYGHCAPEWAARRKGCDLYHLGSLVLFLFTGTSTTHAVLAYLDDEHHPKNWTGDYTGVQPYVYDAFDRVALVLKAVLTGDQAEDLVSIFRELCSPLPALRGDPRSKTGHRDPYSLERYVTRFDLLARRAESGFLRLARL